ncbi:response regulator receiver domain protein [Blautia hansenii DSM 20583]|jgi:DNA-binding response OmpR family regulator|uniref:Stage 0 sporulation protein A homolog n=2 Tax=Blautia hansenii TaxID=1322 RepID=C9L4T3_BLAHA|nr:DNA-binding response regulator [Blautia hansenii DSM 20583]EEX22767.1 response regulator receiver domain protein [Blautia hansenii DSM 20583]
MVNFRRKVMKEEKKILIVEDDTDINNLLFTALKKQGYTATQAFSGTEAKMLLKMENFALILLDLMLPGISGEEVLEFIKEQGNSAVIILTAKDTLDDKVNLLIAGADDYITKPFEIQEVLARVQVQLRRSVQEGNSNVLSHKQMVLDREKFQIKVEGQLMGKITKQEFSILELLLKHPKQVFSKEDIFEYAWEEPYMGETKTLDVHISNIRKKIKEVTKEEYIETVWGIGYRLQQ